MPNGAAPKAGEYFRSSGHARTLKRIAETNGKAFYEGDIAEEIAAYSHAHHAALTLEDLAQQRADWCGTISKTFDDCALHEIPPNGQGIAALMGLGILSHTGIRDMDAEDPRALHLQIEAMTLALRDAAAFVGDLDHMKTVTVDDLLDDGYLAARARKIDLPRATDFGAGAPNQGGTVYLTAADASGMMVSFIQSNYAGFGSGVVVPGTGIALQNRGAGFSLDPAHQNCGGPNKRPFHTIIPGFLMGPDGPRMSFGVMGGPMQAQGHVQMVLRTQLFGQDPQMAADAPRWRVTNGLGLACETTLPAATLDALRELGHQLSLAAPARTGPPSATDADPTGPTSSRQNTRQLQIVLPRAVQRDLVPGIGVAHHPGRRIVPEHVCQPPVSIRTAIAADHHARMLRKPHADTTAMVQRYPGGTAGDIQHRIEQRPVADGIRTILHRLCFAVGRGNGAAVQMIAPDHHRR